MTDFDTSGNENPWTDFDETWHGWLCPGRHPIHENFRGVAQRGWSGQMCYSSHLCVSIFSSCCFLCHASRSHFLTDRDDLYTKTRVSGQ